MADSSGKDAANRAVNQLISVIVGSNHASSTDSLKSNPPARVKQCNELAITEYSEAASLLSDCVPDAKRMVSQAQRKLDSLSSLAVLASFIKEVDAD